LVTYFAQQSTGAVKAISLVMRVENAVVSYVVYIRQMLWPTRLAIFYPFPEAIAAWQIAFAVVVIPGVSAMAIHAWRTRPYLGMGWFWYLGTLVPVIGLVQVGMQSHADRYMYIPMVGILVIVAWGAVDIVKKWPQAKFAVAAAGVAGCLACLAITPAQAAYWQNSETRFTHALDVTEDNWTDEFNLGHYLMKAGRIPEAVPHFAAAQRFQPNHADTNDNLAYCLLNSGRAAEAIPYYEAVVRLKPDSADAHANLALAFSRSGRVGEAITQFQAALRMQPDNAETNNNLGAHAF
jgi:tetratricopeptide (TPR) repeat protein